MERIKYARIKIVCLLLIISVSLFVSGCSKDGSDSADVSKVNPQSGTNAPAGDMKDGEGYYFEYNGVSIRVNAPFAPILEELGEPGYYFEAPSCAFNGMDKFYTYSGFEIQTYTQDDKDYVAGIVFMDDSVMTREGVGLNATLEEVTAAYGTDYENSFDLYSYTDGNCLISFLFENDMVVSIEYALPAKEIENGN